MILQRIEQNRPQFHDIPSAMRLLSVSRRAQRYLNFSNPEMDKAGLKPSSREGIWLYITEECLSEAGYQLTPGKKGTLLDVFSVLRRIYKSADEAWDQSPEIREYVTQDPLARVMDRLSWNSDNTPNITDLSPIFNYLNTRLSTYFPDDSEKRERITTYFDSFVKDAAWALVNFEKPKQEKPTGWQERLDFYRKTTGRIGRTIGSIISEVIDADETTTSALQEVFEKASLVSQVVDDVIDSPADTFDTASPSVTRAILLQHLNEYEAIAEFAKTSNSQISYRLFRKLAPQTTNIIDQIVVGCLENIPPSLQLFLNDFYHALPPMTVSHTDPLNKSWHTSPAANQLLQKYIKAQSAESPHKLVDFITLDEQGSREPHLGMLIDPEKQISTETTQRVEEFIKQGNSVVLIGGSGYMDQSLFQETIQAVTEITAKYGNKISVIIFPGHINQIPLTSHGIRGVLNYSEIIGNSDGRNSDEVYPPEAKKYVAKTFKERNLRSISTVYVLCGDPNASVSQVSGIKPINLDQPEQQNYLLKNIRNHLRNGIACIYLEGGSGSCQTIPIEVVSQVRGLINELSPQTLLFVGGGINKSEHVNAFVPYADCIIVGTHLESQSSGQFQDAVRNLQSGL